MKTFLLRSGSVRSRLLVLVALAVVPALGATLWLFGVERREAVAHTEAELLRLVAQATAEHEDLLRLGERVLATAALMPEVRAGDRATCERALTALAARVPELLNPTRVDAAGTIDCVPGRRPGTDVSANPIFTQALRDDAVVVGPYLRSVSVPEPVVPLNRRITDADGRVRGVLAVGIRMGWLSRLASLHGLPEGSVVSMMDASGLLLARSPDAGHVGRRYPDVRFVRLLREGPRTGVVEAVGLDSVRRRVAYAALRAPDAVPVGLMIAVPVGAITAEADRALRVRLGVLLLALLVVWALASVAVGPLLLDDVERLAVAADRIGTGDFTVRTGVRDAPSELQRLARTMDEMAARLGEREERQVRAQKLESLGRLAGGVAHDFNNMLTAVLGNVEEVRDALPEGSEPRQRLDAALDGARRSGELTHQLLAFARRDGLDAGALALGPVLAETAELLRHTLGPDVAITVECRTAQAVAADRARLEQALVNLAINARDAMPGGGTLRLVAGDAAAGEVPAELPAGPWVRLDVRDSGVGMAPEVRARVFEPFFTTKPLGQGTGLGLPMVYATMLQLGGTVTLASDPGRGTTVTLWLRGAEAPAPERRPEAPAPPPTRLRATRILLVDDEVAVRALAARTLRREGHEVVEAADGVEALRVVEAGEASAIDLVFTDLLMPRLGGVALATALRERLGPVPVVFMSGFAGDEAIDEALRAPRTRLLPKPFRPAELSAMAAAMLDPAADPGARAR